MAIQDLETKINYKFKNPELLQLAVTHRSFLNENRNISSVKEHNERIEFLGDAVLELVVTRYLYDTYPEYTEGELTSFRAAVVRTESLAESALKLGLGEFINMSRGEEATGGRNRPYILANTVESIIGAIYLDSNYESAARFIAQELIPKLPDIVSKRSDIDPKSKLQELAQEQHKFTPLYEVVSETGPDHDKIFTIRVMIADKEFGRGTGKSKQEGEQGAARMALEKFVL